MNRPIGAEDFPQRRLRLAVLSAAFVVSLILLVSLGQPVAVGLVLVVGVLIVEIERRNARALALARRIVDGHSLEKLEVPRGEWGELCRAINRLVQEQRLNQRLRAAAPAALPDDGVRAMIDGKLPAAGEARTVSVLLVSCVGGGHPMETRARRESLVGWQALANSAQSLAQQHGALLQPCGDAIMLVFGAFTERPAEVTLRSALITAAELRYTWREGGSGAGGPLAISLTSGPAMVTTLPGLGCCILGAPVEQAIQIERLALASPYYQLLCDESAYYTLRRSDGLAWRPTEFRIRTSEGRPQVVYGMGS